MAFRLEKSRNNEVKEPTKHQFGKESLPEVGRNAENFDDCGRKQGCELPAEETTKPLKKAERDFEDCRAKVEKAKKEASQSEDPEDFSDCRKAPDSYYMRVRYQYRPAEISTEETIEEIDSAMEKQAKAEKPENAQQLKNNIEKNEKIEVLEVEIKKQPETVIQDEINEKKLERAEKELEQAEAQLKDAQVEQTKTESQETESQETTEVQEVQKKIPETDFDAQEGVELQEDQMPLEARIKEAIENDALTEAEVQALTRENQEELAARAKEKEQLQIALVAKGTEVLAIDRSLDAYKPALREYNEIQKKCANLDRQIDAIKDRQVTLDALRSEIQSATLNTGQFAMIDAEYSLQDANALQGAFDKIFYEKKLDKNALKQLQNKNEQAIQKMAAERDAIKAAMEVKMVELNDYHAKYPRDLQGPQYQKLCDEYRQMETMHQRLSYFVVKLDDNNLKITEKFAPQAVNAPWKSPIAPADYRSETEAKPFEQNQSLELSEHAFDAVPQDRREAVSDTFREAPEAIKRIINEYAEQLNVKETRIIDGKAEQCNYNPYENIIRMENMYDDDTYAEIFRHEYGHFVDIQRLSISTSEEFRSAINEDLELFDDPHTGIAQKAEMLKDLMGSDACYDVCVSDILSGMFRNNEEIIKAYYDAGLEGHYAYHDNDYWDGKTGVLNAKERESFANLFSIYSSADRRASVSFLEKYFPNTTTSFKHLLKIKEDTV